MSKEFFREFQALWAYMDPNNHIRHSGYSDYAASVRVAFIEEAVGIENLKKLGIGPVLLREFLTFKREIHLQDRFKIDIQLLGMSPDGAFWRARHNIYRLSDGKLSCSIDIEGAWFELRTRKMCPPPTEVVTGFNILKKTHDFKTLDRRSRMKPEY